MKKKLLLIALPALMALSGCTYMEHATVAKDNGFFKEDALAHEELFDGAELSEVKIKSPLRSNVSDMAEPLLGVQYSEPYIESGNSVMAVRILAAVKSLDVNAEWTRTVYKDDGDVYGSKGETTVIPATKAYEYVDSESGSIYANSWASTNYSVSGYENFVVLCLYDIPVTTFNNYSIVANLKLSDTAHSLSDVYSKDIAVTIGGNAIAQFNKDAAGYFLAGTIDGNVRSTMAPVAAPAGNVARFSGHLTENDSFYVCYKYDDATPANSKFKFYNSSCLNHGEPEGFANNPFLQDDGTSFKKIKVLSTHNYAFNFNNSFELTDLESGYAVAYTDVNDASVTTPLIYAGKDGSERHQYYADISPKSGTTLVFTRDGGSITPNKEENANVSSLLAITYGGEDLGCYLKDQTNNNYSLWMGYPAASYTLYLNGVAQGNESYVPGGWTDKAIYELDITEGTLVQIKWGDTLFTASASAPTNSYYRVTLHADNTADCVDQIGTNPYRVVGKFNHVDDWDSTSHPLVPNIKAGTPDSEYRLVTPISLKKDDLLKVRNNSSWYPDGSGNDYVVGADGTYQVYFKPNNTYREGWHYDYFYVGVYVPPVE